MILGQAPASFDALVMGIFRLDQVPSLPVTPTARPRGINERDDFRIDEPTQTICTTSMVAESVTRMPLTN